MKKVILFVFLSGSIALRAQELFPDNEPASTVPKGVLGVRVFDETYKEVNLLRNLGVLRIMYGLLPKLSITGSVSMSNHHDVNFPPNLAYHTHNGNQSQYYSGNFQRGVEYPYLYNGIYLYAKYRFITHDADDKHTRVAAYAEWSNVNVAHDEAEPDLLDDTKGYGGGLIITELINRLAISLTSGIIIPGKYNGLSPDIYGGPMVPTELSYGKAVKYNLSFGYLIYPSVYKDYNQLNINGYVEFLGKSYEEAKIVQYGDKIVPIQTPLLQSGSYVDISPGIQAIFKSNLRIDLSVEFPMINQSYAHFYPVYMLGIQRYFYFVKK